MTAEAAPAENGWATARAARTKPGAAAPNTTTAAAPSRTGDPAEPLAHARPTESPEVGERRREFARLLGEFRRTPVLLPLGEQDAPLAGDIEGIRWIFAFSHEDTLARFAIARGEGSREWSYRRVLGARVLDVGVPAVGVPCGVMLDAGSEDGMLFPPMAGIVPDSAAVDLP
ncbi:hypothetical protein IAG42_16560 [Streptomyces xanthii]|uniref:SseB protein N-terminal domain-containing protein n=2 Tax=Streptomyces xanthii TaxID=2768069 RepID=A0A7H1BJ70_9ACTN|nr:hypothetical protein [Streptomyces xanthii]QNS08775.1 hypothetical protein IAG42_16560 [Streptomyces xanthii]